MHPSRNTQCLSRHSAAQHNSREHNASTVKPPGGATRTGTTGIATRPHTPHRPPGPRGAYQDIAYQYRTPSDSPLLRTHRPHSLAVRTIHQIFVNPIFNFANPNRQREPVAVDAILILSRHLRCPKSGQPMPASDDLSYAFHGGCPCPGGCPYPSLWRQRTRWGGFFRGMLTLPRGRYRVSRRDRLPHGARHRTSGPHAGNPMPGGHPEPRRPQSIMKPARGGGLGGRAAVSGQRGVAGEE